MDLFKSRVFNLFLPFVRAQYNIKGAHEVKAHPISPSVTVVVAPFQLAIALNSEYKGCML
jgi:hypothetical protein